MNQVVLMGRFTDDPKLRKTKNGKSVVNFKLAVPVPIFGVNSKHDPDIIHCEAWNKTADNISNNCVKGQRIVALGKIKTKHWKDKDTGDDRSRTYVLVELIYFADSKKNDLPVEEIIGDFVTIDIDAEDNPF